MITDTVNDFMEFTLGIFRNNLIREKDKLEIYHADEIKTVAEYDGIIWYVMNYLNVEGFLEGQTQSIDYIFLFDCNGKQIDRSELLKDEAI